MLDEHVPDVFFTGSNFYQFKALDLPALARHRRRGMKVFVLVSLYENPLNPLYSLAREPEKVRLIREGGFGDAYFNYFPPSLNEAFRAATGYPCHTVLLAANKRLHYPVPPDPRHACDIVYIGSNLAKKREAFRRKLLPLRKRCDVRIIGRDWTLADRALGVLQQGSQYLGLRVFDRLRSLSVSLEEERSIYASARICVNIHEFQQSVYSNDFNERTFKVPACGGFELCDNVPGLRDYFAEDEIPLARDEAEWFEKIAWYLDHEDERRAVAERASRKVLAEHTYHNRVAQLLSIHAAL
jgi:spore maturation protein CgeB